MSGGDSTSVASGGSSYPALDATSPTDSVIAGDFGSLSAQEQERQRDEWKAELAKTEEEIITLKQVLASKEAHAQGLKRRLGITAWREFSEDMTQGLKNLQDSQAYKKTGEAITAAKAKSASVWSSISSSQSFISASQKNGVSLWCRQNKGRRFLFLSKFGRRSRKWNPGHKRGRRKFRTRSQRFDHSRREIDLDNRISIMIKMTFTRYYTNYSTYFLSF